MAQIIDSSSTHRRCPRRSGPTGGRALVGALVAVGLLVALVALLVVRGRSTAESPSMPPAAATLSRATNQVTVHWMGHWLGEDKRETLVREVARDFAFTHPGITVDLKFPHELMGERSERLTADFIIEQIRKPRPDWEVVWLDPRIYQHVADKLGDHDWGAKHLVDFRSVPGYLPAHKPFIGQNPYYATQTGGILTGPFVEGEYMALWYNTNVAARLGLTIRERGMTWQDLLGYAGRVRQAREQGDPVALLHDTGDWLTSHFLFQNLVRCQFADLQTAMAPGGDSAKEEAMRKALKAFAELGRLDPLLPGHRDRRWFASRQTNLDGQTLFSVAGTWMYSHWRGMNPAAMEHMRPCELPTFASVDHGLGGYFSNWGVLKRAPASDAAVTLLMHWCSADVASRWATYTKSPTGLKGDLDRLRSAQDPFESFMLDMDRRYGSEVAISETPVYVLGPGGAAMGDALDEVLRRLLEGAGDPDAMADALLRQAGARP